MGLKAPAGHARSRQALLVPAVWVMTSNTHAQEPVPQLMHVHRTSMHSRRPVLQTIESKGADWPAAVPRGALGLDSATRGANKGQCKLSCQHNVHARRVTPNKQSDAYCVSVATAVASVQVAT